MNDPQGFFEAIAENPDDVTTRLVYADWLEEHEEPRAAEIVRSEAAMLSLPGDRKPAHILERARRKWPYRGWRRHYPWQWVELIGRGRIVGEILLFRLPLTEQWVSNTFTLVVRQTPKTVVMVDLAKEGTRGEAGSEAIHEQPVLPTLADLEELLPGAQRAVLRYLKSSGEPLYLTEGEQYFFWDGEPQASGLRAAVR